MKIALAGNPNSGKTTLFNALTGSNQFVGNWPGVTVEKKEGKLKGYELNRYIAGKDIIAGTFFICGLGAEDFTDLPDDLAEKYEKLFRYPQAFARVPNGILVISENGRTEIIR